MPCPWYREGLCTSPKLESPSSDPVLPHICLGAEEAYIKCRYYSSGERIKPKPAVPMFGKPLTLLHAIKQKPSSDCEYFVVEYVGEHYLAGCKVLRRYLTTYEVDLCSKYWRECPYRKIEKSVIHE
ncbi:MAG: hypothetical protein B7O98_06020 [Zestosphaera tikiterensis]|uniref:Uncharacterized protein n=1 Tax=Zestosphaera tikiterensis TaxID=1973259 RepID=A0A2R7Y3Y0_9CREN|nr:MAG: hypothetical protein B7O98_06020 [Zestosphaera tikiterensis]